MTANRRVRPAATSVRAIAALLLACAPLAACELTMSAEDRIARAEQALAAGDPAAAMIDLRNVLQKDGGNSQARLLLARTELTLGDSAAAAADLAKVDAKAVDAADYEPLRWRIALAERQYSEAAKELAAKRPGLPEALRLTLLGRALGGVGDHAGARAALERALELDPRNGEAIAAHAVELAALGDVPGAIAKLEAGAKTLPNDVDVQLALGNVLLRAGRMAPSETAFRQALALAGVARRQRLAASAGLAETLFAQGKIDDAAKLAADLRKSEPGAGLTLLVAGRVAAARRDYPTALDSFSRLLNADPDNDSLRTSVAAINIEQGNFEQAASDLQRVLARNGENVAARRLLARVRLAQGRPGDATATLEEMPQTAAGELDVALLKSQAALAAGDAKGAVAELERVEREGLATDAARLDLAAAYLQLGRGDLVLRALKGVGGSDAEATRRDRLRLAALASQDRPKATRALVAYAAESPGSTERVRFAALLLSALGEHDSARSAIEGLVRRAPEDADVQFDLARIEIRAGRADAAERALRRVAELRPDANAYVALAEFVASRGRVDESLRLLESARAADAKARVPRVLLARAYLSRRDGDDAQKVADELVALDPSQPQVHLLAASAAVLRKDTARATSEAAEAVRVAPDSAAAWLGKGGVHAELKQREEARAAFRRAQSLSPTSLLPTIALARMELAAGNAAAALDAARQAQQNGPTRAAGQRLEGEILMSLGQRNEAVGVFEALHGSAPSGSSAIALFRARAAAGAAAPESVLVEWVRDHPAETEPRLVLAEHWQRSGERARAIAEYEALVASRPRDAVVLNNLAWLYHEAGDARAKATAQRARDLAPRNPAIADTLGVILVAGGQVDAGLALLREAAAGAPGSADIQYHLAEALARKGANAEAQKVVDSIRRDTRVSPDVRAKAEELAGRLR